MTIIRKSIAFARTAIALFFEAGGGRPVLNASDLDFYLFDRETRMDEVWGSAKLNCQTLEGVNANNEFFMVAL